MGLLWDIVQRHIDAAPYPPSIRQIARRIDVSPTTVGEWRNPKALPSQRNLQAIAELTGTAYRQVLDAALRDTGYITEDAPAPKTPLEVEIWLLEQDVREISRAIEAGELIDTPESRQMLAERARRLEELRATAGEADARRVAP